MQQKRLHDTNVCKRVRDAKHRDDKQYQHAILATQDVQREVAFSVSRHAHIRTHGTAASVAAVPRTDMSPHRRKGGGGRAREEGG